MAEEIFNAFNDKFILNLLQEERKYLALNPIENELDITQFSSKTNYWYKRTTVFWRSDTIIKVIAEQRRIVDGNITFDTYTEYDTELKTENRLFLLPLTSRGKKKKLTAANLDAITPFGCTFRYSKDTCNKTSVNLSIANYRNNKHIEIGEQDKIEKIINEDEFHRFMKYYIETCPPDYFDKVKELKESKHITVKYNVGDVFRVDVDRFNYCYGLITGKVKEISKWNEIHNNHSLKTVMMVPIMVRFFDLITTDKNMTVEQLENIPLSRVSICGDNDIIWGTHKIIGRKTLQESDIEFNLVCSKTNKLTPNTTINSYETLAEIGLINKNDPFNLYVEWGTSSVILPYDALSQKLKGFLKDYHCPHGGVSMAISPEFYITERKNHNYQFQNNLLNEHNDSIRKELFKAMGLNENSLFDDFASKFGGLSKKEILSRII